MMLKKIFIVVSVTALLLPFVLLTDVTDAQFTPRWGGTLVIADRDHPGLKEQTINPIIYYGYQYGPNDIFSRLVYYDHNTYEVKCDLAESWEYTSDWKEFTFHLRRDVKWHDGEPFTSADVKWHYEALIDAGGWQSAYFVASEMKPIETPDDYTVIFKFEKPLYPLTFADQHMDQFILPKHLYEGTDLSENPTNHHPIGTGPFKFVEWGGTEYYRMEANEDYYLGRPYLDSVVFRYFATAAVQTAILGLKKGELDVINDYLYISPSEIPGINAVPGIYARGYPYTTTWRIAYNFGEEARAKHPWLGDVRCRQALAMAIDRDKIIETLIKNQTTTTDTVISSTMPEYNDEAIKYKYDPEEAERLLDEAGYERGAGGTRFSFSLATYSSAVDWAEAIAFYWEEIGVDTHIDLMEASTFISIIERGEGLQDRPAGLHTMGTGPNPLTIMTFLHGNRTIGQGNCGYYNNDKVNELLDQVIASNDEEEITQAIKDIQAEVQKDCALINLWNKWRTFAYDTDFKNMESVWPFSWVTGLSSVWWSGGSTEKPGEPTPTPEARIPMEYFAGSYALSIIAIIVAVYAVIKKH